MFAPLDFSPIVLSPNFQQSPSTSPTPSPTLARPPLPARRSDSASTHSRSPTLHSSPDVDRRQSVSSKKSSGTWSKPVVSTLSIGDAPQHPIGLGLGHAPTHVRIGDARVWSADTTAAGEQSFHTAREAAAKRRLTPEERQALFSQELISSRAKNAQADEKDIEEDGASEGPAAHEMEKMGAFKAWANLVAYTVAVVVTGAPSVMASLGIVPVVLMSLLFCSIAYWSGMQYFHLRMKYPGICNLEDAGYLLYGPVGRELFGLSQLLFSIFLQGSHVILGSKALATLGWHDDCFLALGAVFAIMSWICNIPRDYAKLGGLAGVAFLSICSAIVFTMIVSGIEGPQVPAGAIIMKNIRAFGPSQPEGITATAALLQVTNLFLSFGSHTAFLPVLFEMKNPAQFPKVLRGLIAVNFLIYVATGVVIYATLGRYVVTPAFDSLPARFAQIAYGIALPTIIIAGCESGQIAAKQVFVRIFRSRPHHMTTNTLLGWGTWLSINAVTWGLAWLLASLIPFFPQFLGLEASLLWVMFIAYGALFFAHLNPAALLNWRAYWHHIAAAVVTVLVCAFICVAGTYASARSIADLYRLGEVAGVFSCARAAGAA